MKIYSPNSNLRIPAISLKQKKDFRVSGMFFMFMG